MFCPKCGTQNQDTAKFCEKCGQRLELPGRQPAGAVAPVPVVPGQGQVLPVMPVQPQGQEPPMIYGQMRPDMPGQPPVMPVQPQGQQPPVMPVQPQGQVLPVMPIPPAREQPPMQQDETIPVLPEMFGQVQEMPVGPEPDETVAVLPESQQIQNVHRPQPTPIRPRPPVPPQTGQQPPVQPVQPVPPQVRQQPPVQPVQPVPPQVRPQPPVQPVPPQVRPQPPVQPVPPQVRPQPPVQPVPPQVRQQPPVPPAPLKHGGGSGNYPSGKVKKKKGGIIVVVIELLLLAGICAAGYLQYQKVNDPQRTLEAYLEAVKDGKWEEAYSYLYKLPKSDFMDVSAYQSYMESAGMGEISDYSVEDAQAGAETAEFEVEISAGKSSKETAVINMVKSDEKQLVLLDVWKVSLADHIVKDIEIVASETAEVKLDGILLDDDNSDISQEGDDLVYKVPEVLAGTHMIEVSVEDLGSYVQEASFIEDEDYAELPLPALSEEKICELGTQGAEIWNQVLEAAVLEDADTSGLDDGAVEDAREDMKSAVEAGSSGYIAGVSLDHLQVTLTECRYLDGKLTATLELTSDQTVTGMKAASNGAYEETVIEGTGTFEIDFVCSEGEWEADSYFITFTP